ncbi:MAG: ketoacyl-ACP synthase III [Bacteroidales bacterium]|nr:ketoacyl-ACP synthase III [Bacteroidales bacterium]MDD4822937.1 ketoacyl-ACP synthase III [Bacteroidales bacterium]
MKKINAVITGIGGYLPDYILTNEELSRMIDTTDEWITTRVGIKERRILHEKGLGSSYMGRKAAKQLLSKTGVTPEEIDLIICATSTGDHIFPSTSSIIAGKLGCKNAFTFDLAAACSGFLYALQTARAYICSGLYKKVMVITAEKMSSITNYEDRSTCPLFGDGASAVLVEPTTEDLGIVDAILHTDGIGLPFLHLKSGGSVSPASRQTVRNKEHFIYQEGKTVYKYAVSSMSQVSVDIMERNSLTNNDVKWFVPHQANNRIIEAVATRMNLTSDKTLVNIDHIGNTSAASIPICLWENEELLKKADNIIISAFGAGFTWGAIYMKWGYDGI